ncbi:MAG: uracil phosphoribosyltransferase [Candidatus Humimicrobiia bacterium]
MESIIIDHPLVKHKLGVLRNEDTKSKEFREIVEELAIILIYEATKDIPTIKYNVKTPLIDTEVEKIKASNLVIIPIIRAGLGMLNGALKLIPGARVGHLGIYRNEKTLQPVSYYMKSPKLRKEDIIFIIDPMFATGGSMVMAIDYLKKNGAKKIKLLSIVSAPEGIKKLNKHHPDVEIITCVIDSHLNKYGYIIPGLGDAGDRLYNIESEKEVK